MNKSIATTGKDINSNSTCKTGKEEEGLTIMNTAYTVKAPNGHMNPVTNKRKRMISFKNYHH